MKAEIGRPIRIELPTRLEAGPVNVFLFKEPEPVLVDTGIHSPESWAVLTAGLAEHGLSVSDIRRVIITHTHLDHCGQAGHIARESQAEIWISELGAPWLLDYDTLWRQRSTYYRQLFPQLGLTPEEVGLVADNLDDFAQTADMPAPERVHTFPIVGEIEIGGLPWRIEYLPGHASTQTGFYQPDTRQFLAADMLLAKAPSPIVETPVDGRSRVPCLPIFLESCAKVEALDIDIVYPGHGEPFGNHRQLIANQRARIRQRMDECVSLIQQGHHTFGAIIHTMYAYLPPPMRFFGLWMLIGYLDMLQAEGRVVQREVAGVWHYDIA